MNIAIILDSELLTNVVLWGRQQDTSKHRTVIDTTGQMDAESLRRWLRNAYKCGTDGILGSWRKGYEINLCTGEVVGVTNGHGSRFKVYYRRPMIIKMDLDQQTEMEAAWNAANPDDDYGLEPREIGDLRW